MGLLRKATIVSLGLSLLGAVLDWTSSSGSSAETAAELALVAKVLGSDAVPAGADPDKAGKPRSPLSLLGQ